MTIFKVNSNLRRNGSDFKTGSIIEENIEDEGIKILVTDGVLEVIEGADSIAKGAEITEAEAQAKAQAEADAEGVVEKPKNTWEAKKDEEETEEVKEEAKAESADAEVKTDETTTSDTVDNGDKDTGSDL